MKYLEVFLILFQILSVSCISFAMGYIISANSFEDIKSDRNLRRAVVLNIFAITLNFALIIYNLFRLMRW